MNISKSPLMISCQNSRDLLKYHLMCGKRTANFSVYMCNNSAIDDTSSFVRFMYSYQLAGLLCDYDSASFTCYVIICLHVTKKSV